MKIKKIFIMKNVLTIIFVSLISFGINAQVNTDKGTMLLGLGTDGLSFNSLSINDMDGGTLDYDVDKNTRTTYGINTKLGYFISDGLAVGLGITLGGSKSIYEVGSYDAELDSSIYIISPFVRYHFGESGVYGEVAYSTSASSWKSDVNGNDYESDPRKLSGLIIGAGYTIYVSDMVSINPSLSYSLLTSVVDDGAYDFNTGGYDDLEIKMSNVGFALGINLYLGGY